MALTKNTKTAVFLPKPRADRPVFETGITTRGYELDQYDEIPAATLLRYCEHARWMAAEQSNLSMEGLFDDDHFMVVRSQEMERLLEVSLHTDLTLRFWVAGAGRSTMLFGQEVLRAADRSPVARVRVLAVRVGPGGKPASLPDGLRAKLVGDGIPRFETTWSDTVPPDAFRVPLQVRPSDLDLLRHVNHSGYLDFAEKALHEAVAASAYGLEAPVPCPRIERVLIDYLGSALGGDRLEVVTWALDKVRAGEWPTLVHLIFRQPDGALLTRIRMEVRPR